MIEEPPKMIGFLKGLRRESGAYADSSDGEANLRPTLSVIKILSGLGELEIDQQTINFIRSCRHESGAFSSLPQGEPSAFDTADALIALKTLAQEGMLEEYIPAATEYMSIAATSQYDHFMLVAAYEECEFPKPIPRRTIEFFNNQLSTSLDSSNVLDTAIAAASLFRAHQSLDNPDAVVDCVLTGQNTLDGGFGDGDTSSLMTTYCAIRALVLLNKLPDFRRLLSFFNTLQTEFGYADSAKGKTSASVTYQIISVLGWLQELHRIPVNAARQGDCDYLRDWLENGGEPNFYDIDGWTVLLAAASRGQSQAVDLLLNHDIPEAPRANPELRYPEADALPIYMAGQAGDIGTVKLLLEAEPKHLHAISAVNGHTVLLQAAFYGKASHLNLASYLLDNASDISRLPPDELAAEQVKLLSATNVRGYNALTMQDLWHNQKMKDLLLDYYPDESDGDGLAYLEARTEAYFAKMLLAIATPQTLTEKMMVAISAYLDGEDMEGAEAQIDAILQEPAFNINRLGGELQQPPLIFAITGVDVGIPERGKRRYNLAKKLLDAGADPAVREKHPMAIGAVIRSSVLNNFGLLKLIASYMTTEAFAREMNTSPAVNGLTAMHDAIHRALTSPPAELEGHVTQITWMIKHGARLDIPDNVGQTQGQLAETALKDTAFPRENVEAVLEAIDAAKSIIALQ